MLLTHTARCYGAETDVIPTDERLTAASDVPWYALLRDGKFKYIRNLVAGETEELYDLDADPEEVYQCVLKAFEAGANGIVASREYEEMRLPNLQAVGRAMRELERG